LEKEGFLASDLSCWLCQGSELFGIIKGWFKGLSLDFFSAPHVMVDIILARSIHNYPNVAPTSQGSFWSYED
jgi:hypothetical protein